MRPQADRLLVAALSGTAKHHVKWRELTVHEHEAAVAALREVAAGRADLLAEVVGLAEGFNEGEPYEPIARQVGMLCRRDAARLPPFSGGVR